MSNALFSGNASNVNLTTETTEELVDFLDHVGALIKTLISVFSLFSVFLVWWYAELERRLLIIRHHMCAEVGLMFSPLARGFFCEVFINLSTCVLGVFFCLSRIEIQERKRTR